jgi:hypothetical protein
MNKFFTIISILIFSIIILGCTKEQPQVDQIEEQVLPPVQEEPPQIEEPIIEPIEEELNLTCQRNSDCLNNLYCIDLECKTLADINVAQEECETKCSLTNATITTSDGEEYTLRRGQGSYSYAGAIEWKIGIMPAFCPSKNVKVPLVTIKKNYGEILGEQITTLTKGQTSEVITHPTSSRVNFQLTLKDFKQTCE